MKRSKASVSSRLAKQLKKKNWVSLPASPPPLTAEQKRALAEARKRPIDFSEIPDLCELKRQGRLVPISHEEWHRQAKQNRLDLGKEQRKQD